MDKQERLSPTQLEAALSGFIGSEQWFRVYPNVLITEGVKFLCDQAKCYWLIDCIYSYQTIPKVAQEVFQMLELTVNLEEHTGILVVTDGNDNELHRQALEYTDFPLQRLKLYYTDGTVLLPREY